MRKGYFGDFGGCFVPELLMPPLMELEKAMAEILPSLRSLYSRIRSDAEYAKRSPRLMRQAYRR